MNLETQIRPELWAAIANSYQTENYTHAIKDAMAFVTDALRDKTGLDGDGQELVGKALGFSVGKPPRIQVNKLETETERNIQNGLQQVLRGMYLLIRNPRSHQRLEDTQKTADTIILFIDYILALLGRSTQSFTIQDFLDRVTDEYFVQKNEYVEELINTIPIRKQFDTLIEVYREKSWRQSDNFKLVIQAILKELDDSKVKDFLAVVSEELQFADRDSEVSLIIKILPSNLWPQLSRIARLRAENMLIKSLEEAWYLPDEDKTNNSPSTWISEIAEYFSLRDELNNILLSKLYRNDFDHQNFIGKYIMGMGALQRIFTEEDDIEIYVDAISMCVERGNKFMKDSLVRWLKYGEVPEKWVTNFSSRLKELTNPEKPECNLPDGSPFLGKFKPSSNSAKPQVETSLEPGEEIPF